LVGVGDKIKRILVSNKLSLNVILETIGPPYPYSSNKAAPSNAPSAPTSHNKTHHTPPDNCGGAEIESLSIQIKSQSVNQQKQLT
jgi:hypothetical protein